MSPNISGLCPQRDYSPNTAQISAGAVQHGSSETSPLTIAIENIDNTTENKRSQSGWLKNALIVGGGLASLGLLVAGAYLVGRATTGGQSENALLPNLANSTMMGDTFVPPSIASKVDVQQFRNNSTYTTEIPVSPYSYYENIYGNTAKQNKTLLSIPVTSPMTTTEKPAAVTAAKLASVHTTEKTTSTTLVPDVSEKFLTTYRHESNRSIYYNTINKSDIYYPLGKSRRQELADFCNSDIQTIVHKAYQANSKYKCELLSEVAGEISYYKEFDIRQREINSAKDQLTVQEHADEIMARRKLTTLYLAAETIINGEDAGFFYDNAMLDNKNYTPEELMQREKNIMNYFPEHDALGEC